jgi:hypothetical protein
MGLAASRRNPQNALQTGALQHAFINGAIFFESCAIRLDLQQIYGNGRAMRQKVSRISRCIINAS